MGFIQFSKEQIQKTAFVFVCPDKHVMVVEYCLG